MEEERREVRELPLELLNSDMGEMHDERPGRKKFNSIHSFRKNLGYRF